MARKAREVSARLGEILEDSMGELRAAERGGALAS
jgi:hypothetical protein